MEENHFISSSSPPSGSSSHEFLVQKRRDSLDYLDYSDEETTDNVMQMSIDDLEKREQELLHLNDKLNKKTKQTVQKAEELVKQQEAKLSKKSFLTAMISKPSTAYHPNVNNNNNTTTTTTINTLYPRNPSGNHTNEEGFEEDDLDIAARGMAPEAAIKFYRARAKGLEKDVKDMIEDLREKDTKLNSLDKIYREEHGENLKLKKQNQNLRTRHDKIKKEYDDLNEKLKKTNGEVDELRKELEFLKRNTPIPKNNDQNMNKVQLLKLNRAIDEAEKFKMQITELKKQNIHDQENTRFEISKLREENKILEKQKHDLVLAFKKQMKLIDLLKRQKLHIESARLLSFTEEEFMKTLDLGNR